MAKHRQVLLEHIHHADQHTLVGYESRGGYTAAKKALGMAPSAVTDEVIASGIRGRGGAGFPTGKKWTFLPKERTKPVYLIMNADESEPGTFKDRLLIEQDPHKCIEGMIISAWATQANWSCIYIRGEYGYPYMRLNNAVKEAYAKGYLGKNIFGSNFNLDLVVHRGAGAYICGEETALIESLEGFKGQPRIKPPYFPAVLGLYHCPTIVNNVETIAAVPWILTYGGKEYASVGTEKAPGTKLFSASGHIEKPGVYEVELGYSMTQFIEEECGGVWKGRKLKAVIPGGSSSAVLTPEEVAKATLDYEGISGLDRTAMLGSGGFIVLDETADMVEVARNIAHFYAHESCGQCTPCREGGHWVEKIMNRVAHGKGAVSDPELIMSVTSQIMGQTICVFGEALSWPAQSYIKKFGHEFAEKIEAAAAGKHRPPLVQLNIDRAGH